MGRNAKKGAAKAKVRPNWARDGPIAEEEKGKVEPGDVEKADEKADGGEQKLEKTLTLSRRNLTDMLTCPLCLDIFCEPVGTTCGHTFCRICLGDALKRTKRECPMCRAVCMLDINKVKENRVIASLVQEEFADELEIKKKEMVDAGTEAPLIPVFIYNRVTFPGEKGICFGS